MAIDIGRPNNPPIQSAIVVRDDVGLEVTQPWTWFFLMLQRQIASLAAQAGTGGGGGGGGSDRAWTTVNPATGDQTFDASGFQGFKLILTGDVTIKTPSVSGEVGKNLIMVLIQDSAGDHRIEWDPYWFVPDVDQEVAIPNTYTSVYFEFGPAGTPFNTSFRTGVQYT